jgi:hypothetical protein
MNNPYFNKNHPKTGKEKIIDVLYCIAIPFLWLGTWVLKLLNFPRNWKWLRSLFTDTPIPISKHALWFYVRGKKKSMYELLSKEWMSKYDKHLKI